MAPPEGEADLGTLAPRVPDDDLFGRIGARLLDIAAEFLAGTKSTYDAIAEARSLMQENTRTLP